MTILLFLFGVAVAAGLFFILADILKLPRLSTEKALLSAGRTEKTRMKSLDALFLGWAIKLSKYIRMDEYKRHRLERTLNAAGMDMTPEVYLAYTILKPAAALLAVIPCLLIFPLLSPIVVLLSILLYFKESRKAEEMVAERREKIEGELPRFVATVEQELGASRDVLTILENYKRHAGPDFGRELDVLTADMRSSSYEAALVRFEGRLASPMLSDIVRGLIGVLRGDDGRIYFHRQRRSRPRSVCTPSSCWSALCSSTLWSSSCRSSPRWEGCSDEKQMEETLRRGLYRYLRPRPLRHAGDRIGGEGTSCVCCQAAA